MANQVVSLPKGFGAPSKVFAGHAATNDELGHGVAPSYGVIGYRGKVWSTKYSGTETPLMREDGDGPRGSIEVVLIKASPAISKIFYKNGYQDGSNQAPDCWSADGVLPNAGVQAKQSTTCANCPMNAWGSRVTDAGKPGKACSDSRRLAVVPLNDMDNEAFGGPMLLRVPAASLKDLKAYGELLNGYGYPYYAVATRIAFDPAEAFPKFVFTAIRPLSDPEAMKIMELRNDKRVGTVLSETVTDLKPEGEASEPEVPKSPFEQDTGSAPAKAAEAKSAPKTTAPAPKAAAKAPAKAPAKKPLDPEPEIDEETGEVLEGASEDATTKSFDALLDDLLT